MALSKHLKKWHLPAKSAILKKKYNGMGWDGRALLIPALKSNHSIEKIIFVLGSYEFFERLEGKIR